MARGNAWRGVAMQAIDLAHLARSAEGVLASHVATSDQVVARIDEARVLLDRVEEDLRQDRARAERLRTQMVAATAALSTTLEAAERQTEADSHNRVSKSGLEGAVGCRCAWPSRHFPRVVERPRRRMARGPFPTRRSDRIVLACGGGPPDAPDGPGMSAPSSAAVRTPEPRGPS